MAAGAVCRAEEGGDAAPDAPRVRVLTPTKGYLLGALGERRIAIVVELIDVSGAGLLTTDTGVPRFVEPDRNARLFLDYVVARATYTNDLGQDVVQMVSIVPAAKLELADFSVSPPIHFRAVRPSEGEVKFTVPSEAMAEAAVFNFQIQDLTGARSRPEDGRLIIGLAREVWAPEAPRKPQR